MMVAMVPMMSVVTAMMMTFFVTFAVMRTNSRTTPQMDGTRLMGCYDGLKRGGLKINAGGEAKCRQSEDQDQLCHIVRFCRGEES